jgi:hypothetical protein
MKISPKVRNLLERPIEVQMLPALIPGAVAAICSSFDTRTLLRHEQQGELTPVRVGSQRVFYRREEFLRWLGIEPPKPAPAPAPTPVEALLPRIGRPLGSKNKAGKAKAAKAGKVRVK